MKDRLNLAFIGGGINSAVGYAHFCASQLDSRFQVVAGCFSRNEEINKSTSEYWKVSRIYKSYSDLLDSEVNNIDAVVVLTPTDKHTDIILKALDLGIPIICEKSLVDNTNDAKKILNAFSQNNFLAVTYNYTGYPMVRELKKLISEGFLGEIHRIQIEMPQEGFVRFGTDGGKPKPQSWRLTDNQIPVISLDLGVHLYDMVNFLTGERPVSVLSEETSNGWFEGVTDDVSCIAKYTNNLTVNKWYSKCALGHSNGLKFHVYGSKASAKWKQINPEELIFSFADGSRKIVDRGVPGKVSNQSKYNRFKVGHPSGFIEAFANLYSDIADLLTDLRIKKFQNNHEYIQPLKHSIEGLNFFQCAHVSHQEKKWVNINENQ